MNRIPDKWQKTVLAFSLDLARDSENFPKKALALLDKHFGFHQSIFLPFGLPIFSGKAVRRVWSQYSYITYGIRYGTMHDYRERMHKHDIFRYSALPNHLKGRRVVCTEDVMPLEDYERTAYGTHMAGEDLQWL